MKCDYKLTADVFLEVETLGLLHPSDYVLGNKGIGFRGSVPSRVTLLFPFGSVLVVCNTYGHIFLILLSGSESLFFAGRFAY